MILAFIYLFMIVVPGIFVVVTMQRIIKAIKIQKHGVHTLGRVIKITTMRHGSSNFCHLLIEYRDSDGRYYAAKATVFQGQYQQGAIMPLQYLAHKPSRYHITVMREAHWGILMICAAMLGAVVFACFKLVEIIQSGNY